MTRLMPARLLMAFLAIVLVTPLLAGCEAHGNVDDHDFNVDVQDQRRDRNHDGNHDGDGDHHQNKN